MQPLPELINGLKILEPFLIDNGFSLDNYENGKGSGGQYTNAKYSKTTKSFLIGYRFSIGFVTYQCDNAIVNHGFYLDKLGYADSKQFPDFQTDDKLLAFRHILHDFDFLISDFFQGDCQKLKKFARLQQSEDKKSLLTEFDKKSIEFCKKHLV